jgi:3-hydroxy-9,10-secoandrosta-1,3,5(10)-triene-9,17-dione monooxygenase reductase component
MTTPNHPRDGITGDDLRVAMRHVPSAVTIITVGGREPRGVTIASFSSVSLEPPLISFNVQKDARVFPLLERASRYAVHVLPADRVGLSDHFADPNLSAEEQFGSVDHSTGEDGLPILAGMLAVLECEHWAIYDAGDHALFVGRVLRIEDGSGEDPVLYFRRSYRTVGGVIAERS